MLHYYDVLKVDMYLNHAYASDDLTMITCPDQSVYHYPSPACEIKTSYRPAAGLLEAQHEPDAIFYLEYHLSSKYLPQWRDIDKKLKALFDQFIRNATHRSAIQDQDDHQFAE